MKTLFVFLFAAITSLNAFAVPSGPGRETVLDINGLDNVGRAYPVLVNRAINGIEVRANQQLVVAQIVAKDQAGRVIPLPVQGLIGEYDQRHRPQTESLVSRIYFPMTHVASLEIVAYRTVRRDSSLNYLSIATLNEAAR